MTATLLVKQNTYIPFIKPMEIIWQNVSCGKRVWSLCFS